MPDDLTTFWFTGIPGALSSPAVSAGQMQFQTLSLRSGECERVRSVERQGISHWAGERLMQNSRKGLHACDWVMSRMKGQKRPLKSHTEESKVHG
ncbi:hypothetical protein ACVWXP_003423 [Bradyrhizobium sp. USDA 4463]